MSKELSRKELSAMTGNKVSERTICNREKEWGLDKARKPYSSHPVLYGAAAAVKLLKRQGLLS